MKCIICDENEESILSVGSHSGLDKIKAYSEEWAKIGKNVDLWNRCKNFTLEGDENFHYHRTCYQKICHKTHLENAKKKYDKEIESTLQEKRSRTRNSSQDDVLPKTRKVLDENQCVLFTTG